MHRSWPRHGHLSRPCKTGPVLAEDPCPATCRTLRSPVRRDGTADLSRPQVQESREAARKPWGQSCRLGRSFSGGPQGHPRPWTDSHHPATSPFRCTSEAAPEKEPWGQRWPREGVGPGPSGGPWATRLSFDIRWPLFLVCSHVSAVVCFSPCLSPGHLGRHGPYERFLLASPDADEPKESSGC